MHNKSEIIQALQDQSIEFQTLFSSIPTEQFFAAPSERWSIAHHVQHLTSVINRVGGGLANPSVLPPREASPSRDFLTIQQSYLSTLKDVPSEKLREVGSRVTLEERQDFETYKNQMISSLAGAITTFNTALGGFAEEHLETLGMPHPFMGLLSSREMAFFTVYHNTHHQNGIKKLLEL